MTASELLTRLCLVGGYYGVRKSETPLARNLKNQERIIVKAKPPFPSDDSERYILRQVPMIQFLTGRTFGYCPNLQPTSARSPSTLERFAQS